MTDLTKSLQKAKEFRLREQAILACALALFMELGEDRVTVEMIADKVGIGKGTIYKHFRTKNEIYILLLISYEEEVGALFNRLADDPDKEALMREYFRFRVQDLDKYLLFYRLESKLAADKVLPSLMERLHKIRSDNMTQLARLLQEKIDKNILADVPPEFHICAAWALVHGAAAVSQSPFYQKVIQDREKFFEFLLSAGVRMGNKALHEPKH